MNDYETKQQAKRKRYQELADQNRAASTNLTAEAREMQDCIPFGQPILVGHHSEQRDRNFRERISKRYQKAIEADRKARHHERKANNYGKTGVSSDDPEAVDKLKQKLQNLEANQKLMKAANRIIRSEPRAKYTDDKLAKLLEAGFSEEKARALFQPDFGGGVGFAQYALQNNNANIRRLKQRIAALGSSSENSERQAGDIKIVEDAEDNRIRLIFPGKPDHDTRQLLKESGFRWSRQNKAWQRMLNAAGRQAAERVTKQLTQQQQENHA